ncbi:MAG: type IV pilus biogenesis/stability protein PilW [Betaproteobacteria bacterium]|nr:type IV pilus biogenesis/stability protein PilW [Betaproteobacteria bacterium]
MKSLTAFLLALLLAGCAQQAATPAPDPANAPGADQRARIYTELGAGYYSRGQYAVALDDLRKAISFDAAYAPAYNVLGLVHAELREDAQAEQNFRRSLDLSPNYSEANNNYGLFLCQRKRQKEGLHLFESALTNPLYPTPDKALANAGACSLMMEDIAAAETYFTRSLKRQPRQPLALLGMAEIRFRQSHLLAARSLLRFLADVSELSPQALWLSLRVERGLGDKDGEASAAAQLRRRYPESAQTHWLTSGQFDQNGSLI